MLESDRPADEVKDVKDRAAVDTGERAPKDEVLGVGLLICCDWIPDGTDAASLVNS